MSRQFFTFIKFSQQRFASVFLPAGDFLDDLYHGFHGFDGYVFEGAVIAVAAGAQVGAGETHEAELGAGATGSEFLSLHKCLALLELFRFRKC